METDVWYLLLLWTCLALTTARSAATINSLKFIWNKERNNQYSRRYSYFEASLQVSVAPSQTPFSYLFGIWTVVRSQDQKVNDFEIAVFKMKFLFLFLVYFMMGDIRINMLEKEIFFTTRVFLTNYMGVIVPPSLWPFYRSKRYANFPYCK